MPRSPSQVLAASLILLLSVGIADLASAQSAPTEGEIAAARSLAAEGSIDFKNEDYAAALDKLERAYSVVKVPKLGLWYARSLAKNGKLVEAAERYAEVTRLEANGPKAAEQRQAQDEAATEREQLLARIPQLTITVEGAPSETVQVTVDGAAMPSPSIAQTIPINPGKHLVRATGGQESAEQEITIAENEKRAIVLRLSAPTPSPAAEAVAKPEPLPPPIAPSAPTLVPQSSSSVGSRSRSTQRIAGWVALGAGGVGLAVGTITGILVLTKKSDLDETGDCPDHKCTLGTHHDAVSSYNVLRNVSTASFIVGALGGAAGATLLLTAPNKPKESSIAAWLGPASAGVRGRF